MGWKLRETVTYAIDDLPYDENGELLLDDVSKVKIIIPGYVYPVDIGSICYIKRRQHSTDTTKKECAYIEVDTNSYMPERKWYVFEFIEYIITHVSLGKSINTIQTNYGQLLFYIRWCDENFPTGLNNKREIKQSLLGFTNYLYDRVRTSGINVNTAATYQLVAISVCTSIINDPDINLNDGIRTIRRSSAATNTTEPPSTDKAKKIINIYCSIFNQLNKLTIGFEKLPFLLVLEEKEYWLFPNSIPFMTESRYKREGRDKRNNFAYDLSNGEIRTENEILPMITRKCTDKNKVYIAKKIRNNALDKIEKSNNDQYNRTRFFAATLAMQSFIMLFFSNTGMNLSQVAKIQWNKDDSYTVGKDKQGFKTIKCRAKNKIVTFYISSRFQKYFNEYLVLRKFILKSLNLDQYHLLFFKICSKKNIHPISRSFSTHFNDRIKYLFEVESDITTRQWRAFKSDWLIKNTDIYTTAEVLQNTTGTVAKHYIEGSKHEFEKELSEYYVNFKNKISEADRINKKKLSIGSCNNYNKPILIQTTPQYQPDCKDTKGCLFCRNFSVHADTIDLHKLYSFKYVLLQTRVLADSVDQFDELYSSTINRIDLIIEEIKLSKKIIEEDIENIKNKVFQKENLTNFWLRKLEILIDLEVI